MSDMQPHVIPNGDLREHTPFDHCWCKPYEDDGVWVHRSMDRREEYEGGRKPS
jgi:hypothetical protein